MNKNNTIRTAEFCRIGHPDRVTDILADSILDEYLKQDPTSRVAIEVFGCHGIITVGGEVTSNASINIPEIVKSVYEEIGYQDKIGVQVNVVKQSPEIRDLANEGAGDSGIVTGYACIETPEMLPLEVVIAKRIVNKMDRLGRGFLLPDGKVQVSVEDGMVKNIVVSYQAEENQHNFVANMIEDVLTDHRLNIKDYERDVKLIQFVQGGFEADTGLTGRKNVLWYGPSVPIGGGAFAGKDPSKVDRSGAYWARKLAIMYLIEGLYSNEVLVELVFAIGENAPISVKVNGIKKLTRDTSDFIKELNLRQPIYKEASLKGHFGYKGCPWEI